MSEGELKYELLSDLGWMIGREVDLDKLLSAFGERVARAMTADRATLWIVDRNTRELRSHISHMPELEQTLRVPIGHGVAGYVAQTGEAVNLTDVAADQRWAPEFDRKTGYQTKSLLCVPVVDGRTGILRGVLQVLNKRSGSFTRGDREFLSTLAKQIARALDYTSLSTDGSSPGIPIPGRFNHIIGDSVAMQQVYDVIVRAATTDATVLLQGETGTGKGLMARAIHVNSNRREGPLVHVDCTNLPANLVESELFGHERGAYTGADSRVHGKVEMANGGTLFLDEIGEMPLELQGKLLRFLQDRSFERVGGRQTIDADVRIVAATNRNLEDMVKSGMFRVDLYYRIRVINIELPALHRRGSRDIVALARHFLRMYCRRYRKQVLSLSDGAREALVAHTWPGNVREMEHAMERAVVLSTDGPIEAAALGLVSADKVTERKPRSSSGGDGSGDITAQPDGILLKRGLPLDTVDRLYATATVAEMDGNRSAAARQLEISRNRLARLLAPRDDATGEHDKNR